jgi:hypothetical protein
VNEFIWAILLIVLGAIVGWLFRDYRAVKDQEDLHADHMGMYSDPELVHWFRMRSEEPELYWRTMPLRQYRREKLAAQEVSHG